jgi:hypothetical protein
MVILLIQFLFIFLCCLGQNGKYMWQIPPKGTLFLEWITDCSGVHNWSNSDLLQRQLSSSPSFCPSGVFQLKSFIVPSILSVMLTGKSRLILVLIAHTSLLCLWLTVCFNYILYCTDSQCCIFRTWHWGWVKFILQTLLGSYLLICTCWRSVLTHVCFQPPVCCTLVLTSVDKQCCFRYLVLWYCGHS